MFDCSDADWFAFASFMYCEVHAVRFACGDRCPQFVVRRLKPVVADGASLRDAGLAATEQAQQAWADRAFAAMKLLAQSKEFLTADDLDDWMRSSGDEPPQSRNVIGALFMRLVRGGVVEETGTFLRSDKAVKHRRRLPIWRCKRLSGGI